ncbi:MAG: DUF819 family protein [Eubacteriales bacterium]|nr:DUF819 family protein [Eubacteriales bacterium]
MNSLISADNTLAIWTVIIAYVFFAMYAERHFKWAKAVGAALICLVGGMLLSSIGLVPSVSPAYDPVWTYVTPIAIPMILFDADLRRIGRESGKMLFMFLFACVGTMSGAIIASTVFHNSIPELHKVAAIFTGSQTGGSMNVVVMAEVFGISSSMFNAVYIADILTFTFTLFTLTMIPSIPFFRRHYPVRYETTVVREYKEENELSAGMNVFGLAKGIALSFIIVSVSVAFANFVNSTDAPELIKQLFGQKYLVLTLITVILATVFPKYVGNIKGAQEFGIFLMFIFFVAISIEADLKEVIKIGPSLIMYSFIVFLGILLVSLVFGKIFKFSLEEISVSANAALGGPTTAAAVAGAKGWIDLVTPAVLVGTLGYILGNYSGVFIGNLVFKMFGV